MLTRKKLSEIGRSKGLDNVGHAELDYFQDIALFSIYQNIVDELVFKGGTAIYKLYGLDRFSEDLDFSLNGEIDVDALAQQVKTDVSNFGAETKVLEKKQLKYFTSVVFRIKGVLYTGEPGSSCKLRMDINTKSAVEEPFRERIFPLYPDVPSFDLVVLPEREILAEKVRAVMTRGKARDVYDVWFLLKKGVSFNPVVADRKLNYYGMNWSLKRFKETMENKRNLWEPELKPLLKIVPGFDHVKREVLKKMRD